MPRRIQLKRTKGWRMPPNTVKVDRSTRWGNPFRPFARARVRVFDLLCIHAGRMDHAEANRFVEFEVGDLDECLILFRRYAEANAYHLSAGEIDPFEKIRGKNLACWCPSWKPCHADILLELANAPLAKN